MLSHKNFFQFFSSIPTRNQHFFLLKNSTPAFSVGPYLEGGGASRISRMQSLVEGASSVTVCHTTEKFVAGAVAGMLDRAFPKDPRRGGGGWDFS